MNNIKVFGLMALLTALIAVIGNAVGGQSGVVIALLFAGTMNFIMYFVSAKMVLKMYRARTVERQDAPELYDMVDRLRQRAQLPMPVVAIAPHEQPNAFATGRSPKHAVVCVTAGLLKLVSRDEMEGVIAHELAHIRNRDMLLQTVTATAAGAISYLGNMAMWGAMLGGRDGEEGSPAGGIIMAIVAPIAAGLVQMAISRQREYKADAVGAEICGKPLALAGALEKLDAYARRIPMQVAPAAAPLAVINPLSSLRGGMVSLFSTHPPTEQRVRALREQHARMRGMDQVADA